MINGANIKPREDPAEQEETRIHLTHLPTPVCYAFTEWAYHLNYLDK